jgi:hypothetical protein
MIVTHFDEAHRPQCLQMSRINRGQYPAFRLDIPEYPTQFNRVLQAEIGKWTLRVSHTVRLRRPTRLNQIEANQEPRHLGGGGGRVLISSTGLVARGLKRATDEPSISHKKWKALPGDPAGAVYGPVRSELRD